MVRPWPSTSGSCKATSLTPVATPLQVNERQARDSMGGGIMSDNLSLEQRLEQRGVSRRNFLKFCTLMGATLALPASMTPKIAEALSTSAARPPLIWLAFQTCTGDSESFLRAKSPNVAQILLET